MQSKRVILSAGGTGGHLFPAQAVAQMLYGHEILFVAGGLEKSPYFDRAHFSYQEILSATFSLSKLSSFPRSLYKIVKGVKDVLTIIDTFRPDLVIGFGSFYTLPVLIAAKIKGIPFILHEQNAIPGKVNRLFAPFARLTAITFPESLHHLKGKSMEVEFPMRKPHPLPCAPWEYFDLDPQHPVLLLFGGSQGADRLNTLFLDSLSLLPSSLQILHFTGSEERKERASVYYKASGLRHCVKAFEPHMEYALSIASYALTRAGAGTLAELIHYEVPALLIPFPFAKENHQVKNGEHFVDHVQGGEMYLEESLDAQKLGRLLNHFLQNSLEKKRLNIRKYKESRTQRSLRDVIMEVLDE